MLMLPKGLNPSVANPNLTLRGSDANDGCISSNFFQARESAGCLATPSFTCFSSCYFISTTVLDDMNNL